MVCGSNDAENYDNNFSLKLTVFLQPKHKNSAVFSRVSLAISLQNANGFEHALSSSFTVIQEEIYDFSLKIHRTFLTLKCYLEKFTEIFIF